MDVSAVAQVVQNQSPVATQEGDDSVSMLFSYLLKHELGTRQSGGAMLDSNPMINMVGNGPAFAPTQPSVATPDAAPSNANNSQTPSGQNANGPVNANNGGTGQQTGSSNTNANNGPASNAPSSGNGPSSQQTASISGASNAGQQTNSGPAAGGSTQSNATDGQDEVTEATAGAIATAIHLVQQAAPAPVIPTGPVLGPTAAQGPQTGPATSDSGPAAAQSAGPAAPVGAAAAAAASNASGDDDEPEAAHWSLNFLSTVAAATPQIAQQASNLTQVTNGGAASVSTQTTTGNGVTSPSATALVPDAVLAVSGFLQDGGQNGSTGGGTGDQAGDQQTQTGPSDPGALDPDALALAQDAQALFALTSAIQTVAQDLAANANQPQLTTQAVNAPAAATPAAGNEPILPQANAPTSNANNQPNFANQLQESDQTQAPQSNKPVAPTNAVDQIKMQIEKGLAQGSTTIKVQLTPENMGRVEVKLDVQNGSVKATITADRADTLAVLKADQSNLLQSLQDAGLNADSNSLSFQLRGEQQRQFAQANRQNRGQSGAGAGDDDPLLSGVGAASGVSSTSGAGNLDISV